MILEYPATSHQPPPTRRWYCLQAHTSWESRVAARLEQQGVETYWPSREVAVRHGGKKVSVRHSLFPGYLFVQFAGTPLIQANPHAMRILTTDGEPAVIPDLEIDSVRILEGSPTVEPCVGLTAAQLAAGQLVYINRGPMAGVYGTIVRMGKHRRVVVSVSLLAQSVSAEVDAEWLELRKAA